MLKQILVIVCCFSLVACGRFFGHQGYFHDRSRDYELASVAPLVELPDTLSGQAGIEELYPIDQIEDRRVDAVSEFFAPEPPVLTIDTAVQSPVLNTSGEVSVSMTSDSNGFPVLMLELEFDWAWEKVGAALIKAGIEIEDLNREFAVYYIVSPAKVSEERSVYQVKLNHTANGIQVAVQESVETLAPKEVSRLILDRIRENIK